MNLHEPLPPLVAAMTETDFYPHAVTHPVRLIQTHISYVLLTGTHAYKLKKDVNFGFLDFSTLEKRAHFCQEELRLNQQHAPELYQEVVPIYARADGTFSLTPGGRIAEYAVKMREFPQDAVLSAMFNQGRLDEHLIRELGCRVAEMHARARTDERISSYGTVDKVRAVSDDNFTTTEAMIGHGQTCEQFERTRSFCDGIFRDHPDWFYRRQTGGYIRECHGDLHLNNVCYFDNGLHPFDCIEFNPMFRNIDVLYDAAFMVIDLAFRERHDLASLFLNTWLERTGDYRGAVLVPLYCSMRAYIRAKVYSLMLQDPHISEEQERLALTKSSAFYKLAAFYARPAHPAIWIVSGLSGSGKSTVAGHLAGHLNAIHLRSDAVRKHLAGVPLDLRGGPDLYTQERTDVTYAALCETGLYLARTGLSVVLDARYSRINQRAAVT